MHHAGMRIEMPSTVTEVGVARRDISPPEGILSRNWPMSDWDRSDGLHLPLTLSAIAVVAPDGVTQILIAVDGTWWRRVDDEWNVRGYILEQLGLSADQLMLNLSHTHAGPLLCSSLSDLPGGEHIVPYQRQLALSAVEAAQEALANRTPGLIEWVTARSPLAGNRELDLEGRQIVGFNPDGKPDDTLLIGRISALTGEVRGTLVNYACHPTTLSWQNRLVSPDWVGAMREVVELATGAPCLFVQGASGELAPREQYSGDTSLADRHGRSIGHSVLAALEGMPSLGAELEFTGVVESGAPLAMWESVKRKSSLEQRVITGVMGIVKLDLVDLPSLEELGARWADLDERTRAERLLRASDLRDGYIDGPTVDYPFWVWRWGDAVLVGQPGEAYSRLQLTLREQFPDRPVLVMNLTNGPGFAYLPTKEAYDAGAYQAWQTIFAPGSLERLEEAVSESISQLISGRS